MSTQSVADLLGEDLAFDGGLGEDLAGPNLAAGYIPGRGVEYVPLTQLGDGLAGPPNQQQLAIYRDNRVIATDELGRQGPFIMRQGAVARHRAGRAFPLNLEWNAGLDEGMPGLVPAQDVLSGAPFGPDQSPSWYGGVPAPEVLPATYSVPYTQSPAVGYDRNEVF